MASVLVADGEQRSALATVRSLGRAGHHVYVCSLHRSSLAGASRYARARAVVPSPLAEPAAYAEAIRRLVDDWRIDLLLPVTDASLLALLPERDHIPAILPFPSLADFERICDKAVVAELAREVGIKVPLQVHVQSAEQGAALDPTELKFPIVAKPSRSVVMRNGGRMKRSVAHAANAKELALVLSALPAEAYPVLLQERVIGPGVGVFVLMHDGEVVSAFSHRRLREKPPSGGVSVYRESIPLDARLLELSVALLRRFDWEGAAMVEYKVDARSGEPYIMEINGRFWGSLQLAIDAGVDFPALLVAAATGSRVDPVLSYRSGVRSRWLWGDVDHLLLRLRRTPEELALEPGAASRTRAVLDFLAAFGPGSRGEVFRLSDPLPALQESLDWLRRR